MKGPIRAANPGDEPVEVQRNAGKPTQAAELAKALAEARKSGKGMKVKDAQGTATEVVAPAGQTTAAPKAGRKAKASAPPAANLPVPPDVLPEIPVPSGAGDAQTGISGMTGKVGRSQPTEADVKPETKATKTKAAQLRFLGMKPVHVVEAALFAAGKPIAVEEIVETTGLRSEDVKDGLKELAKAYEERDTVLEVGKAGAKWAMQVKSRASEPAAKFAPMEIPAKTLKTLALIAFHQPLKQSVLVDMVGGKAYDHVHELHERGLVKTREEGQTKVLQTTSLFPEYFGLDAASPEEIRATMAKLVGLDPAKLAVAPESSAPADEVKPEATSPAEQVPTPSAGAS